MMSIVPVHISCRCSDDNNVLKLYAFILKQMDVITVKVI